MWIFLDLQLSDLVKTKFDKIEQFAIFENLFIERFNNTLLQEEEVKISQKFNMIC